MTKITRLNILFLLILLTCFTTILPISANAQFPELDLSGDLPFEKLTAETYISYDKVQPGNEFHIAVVVTIADGWHVNANPTRAPLMPTKITAPDLPNITFGDVVYPAGDTLNIASIGLASVYHDTVSFGIPATLLQSAPVEPIAVDLELHYQACNDEQCLLPETLNVSIPIDVASTEETVMSVNDTIFASIAFDGQQNDSSENQGGLARALLGGNLLLAFIFVFGAGIVTSLTPCVYPLIPITVSIFGANESTGILKSFLLSFVYVVGIVITYSILGVAVASTDAVFGQIMADPRVIIPICLILVALGLSMLGIYEIRLPSTMQNRLNTVGGAGFIGAFTMGTVAGIIAAPCTGPALAAVLSYIANINEDDQTRKIILGFSLMATYAFGMGLLFICLGTFSGLISSLPKSGGWMYILENIFGIAIITMALYFLKDLEVFSPVKGFLQKTFPYLVVIGGLWLSDLTQRFRGLPRLMQLRKACGVLVAVLGAFLIILGPQQPAAGPHLIWDYDNEPVALEAAKQQEKLVILDFYASWCAACNELDHKTFSDQEVINRLANYVTVKLDFSTKSDEVLTEKYKIVGLPVVIFMDGSGNIYERIEGFVEPEEMLKIIDRVESKAKDNKL